MSGPLDGVFDSSFRQLVRQFSKDNLLYTEMRHVGCIVHDKTGKAAFAFLPSERPLAYQLTAHDLEFLEKACELIMKSDVDTVDLNCGCPARTVVKQGAGSALMGNIPMLTKILKTLRAHISLPLTIKIRAGFKEKNALEVARLAQDCGLDGLSIHPRLQPQMSKGKPDYVLAQQVKQAITIPVFFSGNIFTSDDAKDVYERTGVDGFLIGRGMWSQPWKLAQLEAETQGKVFHVDTKLIFSTALQHLDNMLEQYGDQGLYQFRKHLAWYIKDLPEASRLRDRVVRSESLDEVTGVLTELMESDRA